MIHAKDHVLSDRGQGVVNSYDLAIDEDDAGFLLGPIDSAWSMKSHDFSHSDQSPYSKDN